MLPPLEELIAASRGGVPQPTPADENGSEPEAAEPPDPTTAHLATSDELEDWNRQAVGSASGHVYQSREWA